MGNAFLTEKIYDFLKRNFTLRDDEGLLGGEFDKQVLTGFSQFENFTHF